MKCKHVRELTGAYLYGDLSPEEMKAVRVHTQQCEACREDIRTRGAVLSSLETEAPELTDEERLKIAWSVKGAIRANEQEKQRFRFTPVYALAAAVLVAVVGIKIAKPFNKHQPALSTAKVTVEKEERPSTQKESTVKPQADTRSEPDYVVDKPATTEGHERKHRHSNWDVAAVTEKVVSTVSGGPAVTSRSTHKRSAAAKPDAPAPVVNTPETPDVKVDNNNDSKLPKPTDVNDARTAPAPDGATNENASNPNE